MLRIFEVISEAFGHEYPYFDVKFPQNDALAGRAAGAERLLIMMKEGSWATFLKVVDREGTIIVAAKWNVYNGETPPEEELEEDWWGVEGGERFYAAPV